MSRTTNSGKNRVDRSLRENGRANIDDRTDNPNAVHATMPDTRVTEWTADKPVDEVLS
ncbi:MAG: hypothetical protein ABOK23_08160 [Candidatus Methanoperedens sp.]|nr:hypothetical protein [Candidatus Methanoperedens sp.]MCZ7396338.1 hypothetical protein [Candidatus Methanoperedens sp.]